MEERRKDYIEFELELKDIKNSLKNLERRLSESAISQEKHKERLYGLANFRDKFEESMKHMDNKLNRLENTDFKVKIIQDRYETEFGTPSQKGNIYVSLDKILDSVSKQNGRIGKLENWRSVLIGGIGIISVAISLVVPIVSNVIIKNTNEMRGHLKDPRYHEKIATDVGWIKSNLVK